VWKQECASACGHHHTGNGARELPGAMPGVVPDHDVYVIADGAPQDLAEPGGGTDHHGGVHPVRTGADRSPQTRGAEPQHSGHPIVQFIGSPPITRFGAIDEAPQFGPVAGVRIMLDPLACAGCCLHGHPLAEHRSILRATPYGPFFPDLHTSERTPARMATPHIAAEPGDFASAVLMPGDPKRAERIATLLMPDARLVTDVRGMLGFTGTVDGRPLSVLGSGMGQPSITIYATELFSLFGVQRIIRVGTCGAISPRVRIGDVIIANGAHTTSNINQLRLPGLNFSSVADFSLTRAAVDAVSSLSRQDAPQVHVGMVVSDDHFYLANPDPRWWAKLARYGVLGVEMEAAALFATANEFGKQALAVLTASDQLVDPIDPSSRMSPEQRETRFAGALRLAVAAAFS